MIGKAIYNILSNDADVAALVSTRIYPVTIEQGDDLPYLSYQIVSNIPVQTKQGASNLDTYRVQINTFAATYILMIDLGEKVRTALDQYSGTVESLAVQSIVFDGHSDLFDYAADVNFRALDFIVRLKL